MKIFNSISNQIYVQTSKQILITFICNFVIAAPLASGVSPRSPVPPRPWYLTNTGAALDIVLDDLTTLSSPSRAGEDLGIPRSLPAPINPKVVRVAAIDTGLDLEHPELKDSVLKIESECEALVAYRACGDNADCKRTKLIDTNQDGYPLNCAGWNITAGKQGDIYGNHEVADEGGHGTHIAGLIHAVAPLAQLIPIKAIRTAPNAPIRPQSLDQPTSEPTSPLPSPAESSLRIGAGFADQIARGILYAIRQNADVINLSLAWPKYVQTHAVKQMIELAAARGILIFAAAGNDNTSSAVFPCQMNEVICVGATAGDGALAHFSNFGSFVDVAAPGLDIISTWPTARRSLHYHEIPGYEKKSGTSMASPLVAGVAAAMLGQGIPASEIKMRLMSSARPLQTPLVDATRARKWIRSGSVDLNRALHATPQPYFVAAQKTVIERPLPTTSATSLVQFTARFKNIGAPLAAQALVNTGINGAVSVIVHDEEGLPFTSGVDPILATARIVEASGADLTVECQIDLSQSGRLTPGRLVTEFNFELGAQDRNQVVRIPLELFNPIAANPAQVKRVLIDGLTPEQSQGTLRTFLTQDLREVALQNPGQTPDQIPGQTLRQMPDFLLQMEGISASYTPLLWNTRRARYEARAALTGFEGELLLLQKYKELNGNTAYALVFRKLSGEAQANPYSFEVITLDKHGAIDQRSTLGGEVALSESFQWLPMGAKKIPYWIGLGKSSAIDLTARFTHIDAWDPVPQNTIGPRLYALTPAGLRSYAPPQRGSVYYEILALLPHEQFARILMAEGNSTAGVARRYVTVDCTLTQADAAFDCTLPAPVPRTQQFSISGGMSQLRAIGSQDLYFFQPTARGRVRLGNTQDRVIIHPQSPLDSVMQVLALYTNPDGGLTTLFASSHSHFLLLQKNPRTGEFARSQLSLDRFSFLPAFIVRQTAFPLHIHGTTPGLLIPQGMGSSRFTEILIPNPVNGLLSRFAHLRFDEPQECTTLAQPTQGAETHLVLYCAGENAPEIRFLKIPELSRPQ